MERLGGTGWPRARRVSLALHVRTPADNVGPRLKTAVLAMFLAWSFLLVLAPAASAGPDRYLCDMTVARGAIPSSFAAQACFDGRTLTISNDLSIPMSVQVRGNVGNPTRTETDYGIAAEATRAVSTDPRILLPGDTLRFPIGSGAAELRLTAGRYADFYVLASTIADFLPGDTSTDVQAVTTLVKEINEDFTKYHDCEDRAGHSLVHKAGCHVILVRNVSFAIGRAGITGVASGALGAIVSATTFSKWVSASTGNLKALLHSGTIRLAAIPNSSSAPPVTQYSVPLSALCSNSGVQLHAVNGCPYNGSTLVGSTTFAYTLLIEDNDESVSPRYWNLIEFPASTCSSIKLSFGMPTTGSAPGDTASIQVAGGTSPTSTSAPYGLVASLSATLNGQPWTLQNSATSSDDQIAVNGDATCSTATGY